MHLCQKAQSDGMRFSKYSISFPVVILKTSFYNFRGERKAAIPRVRTTRHGLRSFRSEAPWIWNSFPNNVTRVDSLVSFRRIIHALIVEGKRFMEEVRV